MHLKICQVYMINVFMDLLLQITSVSLIGINSEKKFSVIQIQLINGYYCLSYLGICGQDRSGP